MTDPLIINNYAETRLPTHFGELRVRVYRDQLHDNCDEHTECHDEPVAIIGGDVQGKTDVPVRIHSACFTSETLGSLRCDCREQLEFAMEYVARNGGVVLYLHQEGRGIGLGNKIAAYALQEQGVDTVDANRMLGFEDDYRSYEQAVYMLRELGVESIRLMTNNPAKLDAMDKLGVEVTGRIPVLVKTNPFSAAYLEAKRLRMGHMLSHSMQKVGS